MEQIVPSIRIVQMVLGAHKMNVGASYRLSAHCMRLERPEGALLYHVLTGELLLLSSAETELLGELPGPVPAELRELAVRWFLRPTDADDMAMADQVREIVERMRKPESALTSYTIFTTMECNARCFYCYEAGWKKSTMTEQIARDTGDYIAAHCEGKPVSINWFGGEPMVNTRAIDTITECLRHRGVEFRSTMISNGYLFDEALVLRARDYWNLKRVQITLDGTEEIYNQRKAYVNPQGSPYLRVIRNIGLLLDAGIQVKVRLNMDWDNESDLYSLMDELAERFAGKPGFGIYLTAIWEDVGFNSPSYTEMERLAYAERLQSLRAYAEEKGIAGRPSLMRRFTFDFCVADSDGYTTVTPDGRLGRCDTSKENNIWGSIYSEDVDAEILRQWKERKPPEEACRACVIYPQCLRLKKCPGWLEHCTPIEQSTREDKISRAVLGAYEKWKIQKLG